eukprot:CAMPEP_0206481050 /NCGR_PEP_ID=MMETSP0324_2-20121206/37855_1 /ASSEMBLY_ACC=CAM_ASM_000836 /TAXON_ID=2866 /ORGANISM="Crypthecodinium cohnii, Strain Seligo" /LENGTH=373 /DNA_ID=CAMNT_0053958347 /DNA_START=60 /DNA_END=1181 /DNA_ORIENTATION=+
MVLTPEIEQFRSELKQLGEKPGLQRVKEPLGPQSGTVCVTGVSGFIALALARQLLEKGYTVVGTVRNFFDQQKMAPLLEFQNIYGQDKFRLVADVDCMEPASFEKAVKGCVGVFHTASPFHFKTEDPLKDFVQPAKIGTESCLEACKKVQGVRRVIVTASFACIANMGAVPPDYTYSSKDWNVTSMPDENGKFEEPFIMNGYRYSKVVAEKSAWDFANQEDCPFDLACINPPMVVGTNINKVRTPEDLNTSSILVLDILKGKLAPKTNSTAYVDVEDVARAHVAAYEHPEAGGRRYLCSPSEVLTGMELHKLLKELAPECDIQMQDPPEGEGVRLGMDCSALHELSGFSFLPVKETMAAQVRSFQELGFLSKA